MQTGPEEQPKKAVRCPRCGGRLCDAPAKGADGFIRLFQTPAAGDISIKCRKCGTEIGLRVSRIS